MRSYGHLLLHHLNDSNTHHTPLFTRQNNTYMDQEVGGKGEAVRMIFRSAIAKKVPPFDVNTFPLVVLIHTQNNNGIIRIPWIF